MENCIYKQICTEEKISLRIYIAIIDNSVKLTVLGDGKAWKAIVTKEKLQHFATEHQIKLENYCEKLLEYVNDGSPGIIFSFNSAEFTVSRSLKKSLMVKYFTCKVKETNYVQCAEEIMDQFYAESATLSQLASTLRRDNAELAENKIVCETKLKELLNKKLQIENDQLSKFVLVLNEKKHRIQHLTELLEAFKSGRSTTNPETKLSKQRRKKDGQNSVPVPKKECISESESSEDEETYSSDGQNSGDSNLIEEYTEPVGQPQPSTSGDIMSFLDDDFADQSHILPKRVKLNNESKDAVVVASAPVDDSPKEDEKLTDRRKSPEIDLSTQQLLDLL